MPHKVEEVLPNKHLVREGEKPTRSCLLLEGFAFRHKVLVDGSRSISAIHMKGDVVDLQNSLLGTADHSVQTLTRCSVAFIPREEIKRIVFAFPNVGMAIWYDTLVDGSIFREWIANVARRDAAARLAHLLCEFGLRLEAIGLGDRVSYELPMTQEQLADATGLTPVHVNRTLKDLEERGLIAEPGNTSPSQTGSGWKIRAASPTRICICGMRRACFNRRRWLRLPPGAGGRRGLRVQSTTAIPQFSRIIPGG